jgi:hypothetical protein
MSLEMCIFSFIKDLLHIFIVGVEGEERQIF